MAILIAVTSVVCFAVALKVAGIVSVAQAVYHTAIEGVTSLLDPELNDHAKEQTVRKAGLALLLHSWQLFWRCALALGAVGLPILAADLIGLVPWAKSLGVLLRVDFIVVVSLVAIALTYVLRKRRGAVSSKTGQITDTSAYAPGDKLVHAFAFSSAGLQKGLARLDDRFAARQIEDIPDTPPIFITSLARGGTTALLNAMHELPAIATHRYCDMPFMTAPALWSRLAGAGRRKETATRERAHGDGLRIGLQSPEAFDEIFWMLHWPEKYHASHVALWGRDDIKDSAQTFFQSHFRKIINLRRPGDATHTTEPVRYLSKNNANVTRLDLLPTLFPGCQTIIVLREPTAHAASLYRQHLNFTELHAVDSFAKRYMRDIGHLEFGPLHRPFAFDLDQLSAYTPDHPNYWLAYWISCFENLQTQADHVVFLRQDSLRQAPNDAMFSLLERLNVSIPQGYSFSDHFHRREDASKDDMFSADLVRRARAVYAHLSASAL